MKKLVIISHTPHQHHPELGIVGWGPTVNEINYLAQHWEEVVHVACIEKGAPAGSSLPYTNANIIFKPIPAFGGKTIKEKLGVLWLASKVIKTVRSAIQGASHVQLRVPMGIGLYLIPYFALQLRRPYIFWVKYANNWVQEKPPLGYSIQRWYLKYNFARCNVTINGKWPGQPSHCISFSNPCVSEKNLQVGLKICEKKLFKPPYNLIFIGRLEDAKGLKRLIQAVSNTPGYYIKELHVIGEGPQRDEYIEETNNKRINVTFWGGISQARVHKLLQSSHFLILPTTASEGFPKVLAEAACYGCIPVCTDISAVKFYIQDGVNGFLIKENIVLNHLFTGLYKIFTTDSKYLEDISKNATKFAKYFSYKAYFEKLRAMIFH